MSVIRVGNLRSLEGRRVSLSLVGGRPIDDCQLISAGSRSCRSVWIFQNGTDEFLASAHVVDCWESRL